MLEIVQCIMIIYLSLINVVNLFVILLEKMKKENGEI